MSKLSDVLQKLNDILDAFVSQQKAGQQQNPFSSQKQSAASQKLGSMSNLSGGTQTTVTPPPTPTPPPPQPGFAGKVSRFKEKHKKELGALGEGWESFKQAWRSEKVGDVASGGFGVVEAGGKALGGPAGGLVEKFAKLGEKLGESLERLRNWNEQLHDANMKFAEFSGAMSAVAAQQQARDIELGQERGERRAVSAGRLAESKADLNQSLAPIGDAWGRVQNDVTAWFNDKVNTIIGIPLKGVGDKLNDMLDVLEGDEDKENEYANEWMNDEGLKYVQDFGKPDRFK